MWRIAAGSLTTVMRPSTPSLAPGLRSRRAEGALGGSLVHGSRAPGSTWRGTALDLGRQDSHQKRARMSPSTRTETDTFGPIEVVSEQLWGAQTQRSLQNFRIGTERMPIPL